MEPLQNASKEGNIDGLYAAIEDNPRILSIVDEIPFVDTPLHIAASSGNVEFALEIMRLKPPFATKLNPQGFSPIHIAIQKKYTQMVLCFVDMDPELIRVKGREGVTPLHLVVSEGNIPLLQRFLSVCPESIKDKNVRYETALHIALKNSKFEAFQLLLDRLQKDTNEETNCWKQRVLNCKDLEGNTLLHISTLRNQFQVIESLLKYNKSNPGMLQLNAMNERKQTAADIALHFHDDLQMHRLIIRGQMVANHDYDNPNPTKTDDHNESQNYEIEVAAASATNNIVSRKNIYTRFLEKYFMYKFRKSSSPEKARSDLLVVAVLMATATYQAVLSPPGGVDDKTGIALLGRQPVTYGMFMFFNSVGFMVSLRIIMVLLYNYPLFWDLYVASIAMAVTYNSAMISITPSGRMRVIFFLLSIIMPIAIAVIAVELRKYVYKKKIGAEET